MTTSTSRCTAPAAAPRTGRRIGAPFASLPLAIVDNPALGPVDKAILLVLAGHAWGGRDDCWPSNKTIASKVGRSVGHVKRRLAALEELGFIGREPATTNRTGRVLRLLWRVVPGPVARPSSGISARPESEECEREKKEPPGDRLPLDGASSPVGQEGEPEASTSVEDLSKFVEWSASKDPVLARFGKAALHLAGVAPEVVEPTPVPIVAEPAVVPVTAPIRAPVPSVMPPAPVTSQTTPKPRPAVSAISSAPRVPVGHPTQPSQRSYRGVRQIFVRAGEGPQASPLSVWASRRST